MSDNLKVASFNVSLLEDLKAGKNCQFEAAIAIEQLERELASQQAAHDAEIAGLEEQVEELTNERDAAQESATYWMDRHRDEEQTAGELRKKLEAAEARIKASQEQEPIYQYWMDADHGGWIECTKEHYDSVRECDRQIVYAHPPELAELQRENAELRKLLESNVPEGWQLVPKNATLPMHDAGAQAMRDANASTTYYAANECYKAMLAAAPQPKEPKQ